MARTLSNLSKFATPIGAALVGGLIFGSLFGSHVLRLTAVSKTILEVIKLAAVPLLFFSILQTTLRGEVKARKFCAMLCISAVNALGACAIALTLVNVLQPGRMLGPLIPAEVARSSVITTHKTNWILVAVVSALATGISIRVAPRQLRRWFSLTWVDRAQAFCEKGILQLTRLVPIAVFISISTAVQQSGVRSLVALVPYLSVVLLGLLFQIFFVYHFWIRVVAKLSLLYFWSHTKQAVSFALGASSSLVTLPITLKTLRHLGVSEGSSRMSAAIGTNLNNDGILLYEMAAAVMVAQAYGLDFGFWAQLRMAAYCASAAIGIAGVPDAGLISLSLVLESAGLPIELVGVLVSVDWIASRARAATNVIADITGAIALDATSSKR